MEILRETKVAGSFVKPYKGLVFLNLCLLLFAGATEGVGLGLIIPILEAMQNGAGQSAITQYLKNGFEIIGVQLDLVSLMLAFSILMVARFGLQAAQMYVSRLLSATVVRDLRRQAFGRLLGARLGFFQRSKLGDFVATLFVSTNNVGAVIENLLSILVAGSFCAVYAVLNLVISVELTLVSGGILLMSVILLAPRLRTGFSQGRDEKTITDQINSYLVDKLGGIRTIKAYGTRAAHGVEFDKLTDIHRGVAVRIQVNRIISELLIEPVAILTGIALMAYAHTKLDLPIALLLTFFVVLLRLVPKVKQAGTSWLILLTVLPHASKVNELIDMSDGAELADGTVPFSGVTQSIRFNNVQFFHEGSTFPALKGVDFSIGARTTVALVGPSGAGKSTLIDLLMRHFDPTSGTIEIDGENLRNLRRDDWRSRLAIVEQSPYLFDESLRENLLYGKPNATEAELAEALSRAHAKEFVDVLPNGIDSMAGERGGNLSGGQRQRIALARALLRNPDILFLDEATSALDSESERLIQDSLEEFSHKKTIIIIAHRLATVQNADKIIVIEDGRAVAEGAHDELLLKSETYRNYVKHQFGG